jgi:hypothetical protein
VVFLSFLAPDRAVLVCLYILQHNVSLKEQQKFKITGKAITHPNDFYLLQERHRRLFWNQLPLKLLLKKKREKKIKLKPIIYFVSLYLMNDLQVQEEEKPLLCDPNLKTFQSDLVLYPMEDLVNARQTLTGLS